MKKINTVLFLYTLSGCSLLFNHPQPKIKNISYYNERFEFDQSYGLRIDGVYLVKRRAKAGYDYINYFRFHSNGMVERFSTPDKLDISDTMFFPREIYGNYKINNDSIYAALDAHYYKKERKEIGYLKDSFLFIKDISESQFEKYLFLKYGTKAVDY